MNDLKIKNEMNKKIKEVKQKAEEILNKGGNDSLRLQRTLESHGRIRVLLNEMDYTLSKDIPIENVLDKISSIEKELNELNKESNG